MVEHFKSLVGKQFEAALSTLNACITECPDDLWDKPIANLAFCQAAFHTLFYVDVYLGLDTESLKKQPFHQQNPSFFRDYEEMEDREQVLMYDRESLLKYMAFCRAKASEMIEAETEETLNAPCGYDWLGISRAELYLYNIRHIQHHTAQLILRLRLSSEVEIPWSRSGWRE